MLSNFTPTEYHLTKGTSDLSPNFQIALDHYMQLCCSSSSTFNIQETAPQPMHLLAVHFFDVVKKNINNNFTLSERDSILWKSDRLPHAQDYLKAIPISGLNQAVGPRHFRYVLQYRLGIPLFGEDSTCPCCKRVMDHFGDHVVHCASEVGQKFRHDMVRDLLADICYKYDIDARKEAPLGFISDTNTPLRPADVTGVSPFSKGGNHSYTPGQAISAAITRKMNKYADKCSSHG